MKNSAGKSGLREGFGQSSKKLSYNQDLLYLLGDDATGDLNYLKQPRFHNHLGSSGTPSNRVSQSSHLR